MQKDVFSLCDTFNFRVISQHRSIEAAVKASRRHARAVSRANGSNSYIRTSIRCNGHPLTQDQQEEMMAIEMALDQAR